MEVLELRDSQWTCQEAADGRLEVSTLREDYDTRRGLMVVLLMFVLPVSLVCSIYLLDKVVSAKVLVMVSLLGWCALLPWAAQKVKQGVHLLTGAGGLDVVGYLGGKVVRQDWLSPRRLEVRRKTIGVMNPDDEGWSTVDAWTLVAISRSGAVSELLWACERPRLEEVAERLKRAMELEDCLEPETSEKGHTNFETLLPVPADYHQPVILKPEQVAIISRKFHEPSRRKVSLGMAGMAALSLGAGFVMGAPLLMAAALPIFAVSFLVLGPELKEYTVFRLDDVLRVDHRGVAFQRLAWSEAAALESDGRQLTARTNKGKSIVLLDLSDGSRDWAHSVAELSSGLRVNAPTG